MSLVPFASVHWFMYSESKSKSGNGASGTGYTAPCAHRRFASHAYPHSSKLQHKGASSIPTSIASSTGTVFSLLEVSGLTAPVRSIGTFVCTGSGWVKTSIGSKPGAIGEQERVASTCEQQTHRIT